MFPQFLQTVADEDNPRVSLSMNFGRNKGGRTTLDGEW